MTDVCSPIRIGTKTLRNRVTQAPVVKFYAGPDGMITDEFVSHYEERAAHGCALIVVEATCVCPEGRLHITQPGLWCDEQIEGHRRLAEAVHAHGALVIPQIHHAGIATDPQCGPAVSPSAAMWKGSPAQELTLEDIGRIKRQFVDTALRAKAAGYDGVQVHGCHAYLINDFASALNQRTDCYGGSPENRARLGCEIISEIRQACGEDFLISVRISGCDPSVEEAITIAEHYVSAGCQFLQVSVGIGEYESFPHDESLPYNRIAALGVRFHEHFKGRVPVSVVNGFRTPEQVRYMFEHDLTDTIDIARGLIADPAFTEAILCGAPYVKCSACKPCSLYPKHVHPCPAMLARGKGKDFRF